MFRDCRAVVVAIPPDEHMFAVIDLCHIPVPIPNQDPISCLSKKTNQP